MCFLKSDVCQTGMKPNDDIHHTTLSLVKGKQYKYMFWGFNENRNDVLHLCFKTIDFILIPSENNYLLQAAEVRRIQ